MPLKDYYDRTVHFTINFSSFVNLSSLGWLAHVNVLDTLGAISGMFNKKRT